MYIGFEAQGPLSRAKAWGFGIQVWGFGGAGLLWRVGGLGFRV